MNAPELQAPNPPSSPAVKAPGLLAAGRRGLGRLSSRLLKPLRRSGSTGLPLAVHTATADSGSVPAGAAISKVILAESDSLTSLLLQEKLCAAGLEVDAASSGTLALQNLRRGNPDGLLIGYRLADIDSKDVIKQARLEPRFSDRPIYVLTCQFPAVSGIAGATKLFDLLAVPADRAIAAFAAAVRGPDSPPAPPAPPSLPPSVAAVTLADLHTTLQQHAAELCGDLQKLADASTDPDARDRLWKTVWKNLSTSVPALASSAAVAGYHRLARLAAVLEALRRQLAELPDPLPETCWRTLAATGETLLALAKADAALQPPQSAETTVVFVDDSPASRTETAKSLREGGFNVVAFGKPSEALEHLASHPADLILLDSTSGAPASPEVCAQIRKLSPHAKTPLIFAANAADLQSAAPALSAASAEALPKPSTGLELLLRALVVVEKHRLANPPPKPAAEPSAPVAQAPSAPVAPSDTPAQPVNAGTPAAVGSEQAPGHTTEAAAPKPAEGAAPEPGSASAAATSAKPVPEPEPAALLLNRHLKIIAAHPSVTAMFDYPNQEFLGLSLSALLKGGLDPDLGLSLDTLPPADQTDQPLSARLTACKKNGAEFPIQVSFKRLSGDSQFCWTAVFQDLSPRDLPAAAASNTGASAEAAAAATPAAETSSQDAGALLLAPDAPALNSARPETPAEALARARKERDALIGRLFSSEMELGRLRTRLDRQIERRRQAEEQVRRLGNGEAQPGAEPAINSDAPSSATTLPAATTAQGRVLELEQRLAQTVDDLTCAQAELKTQLAELQRVQTDRRRLADYLDAANTAAVQAMATLKQKSLRYAELEEQLAQARKSPEASGNNSSPRQPSESETRLRELEQRLADSAEELSRGQAELKRQFAERERSERETTEQLATAKSAAQNAVAALKEKAARCTHLEEELARARQVAEEQARTQANARLQELEQRLAKNAEELRRAQADLEKQAAERERLEREHSAQLTAAQAAVGQTEAALKAETARRAQLAEELAQVWQTADGLDKKFSAEQQARASLEGRLQELEQRLARSAEELERAQANFEKQAAARQSESSSQLTAGAKAEQAEAALKEKATLCAELEEELAQTRQTADTLDKKLSAEQAARASLEARLQELDQRLAHSAEELQRAQAGNQKSSIPSQAPAEADSTLQVQLDDLETRLRASVVSLARVTAELESERGERQRTEQRATALTSQMQRLHEELKTHLESERLNHRRLTELEQQLRERNESLAKTDAALQKETTDRQLAEDRLRTVAEFEARLQANPSMIEDARQAFQHTQELEQQLENRLKAVADTEARLQQHAAERQRQARALKALEREHREQAQQHQLALARLQSALQLEQCERKRLEADLLRTSYQASDSARTGRALINSLRRQMQPPVENLHQCARRLLQLSLPGDQKGLIESMLENALFLQSSIQDAPESPNDPASPAAPQARPAPHEAGEGKAS